MNIFISGINYKTAPLHLREKLSFNIEERKQMMLRLAGLKDNFECILLSTCNRTEVYIYSEECDFDTSVIETLLCKYKGLELYNFKKYFYEYRGIKAVRHLFKVASGLDSMVLGEDQILGQVKNAHELAMEAGTSSVILNRLFREAVTAAKRIKTNTSLSRNSLSVSSLAVKLLGEICENNFVNKCVLVIGTGKMGSLALASLCSKGLDKVYVTNRSHCKAVDMSRVYQSVIAIDYEKRYSIINECDFVISSTSSPHYTITREMLENYLISEKSRTFIDLAVPRDIDDTIKDIPGIQYFNIDHLKTVMNQNIESRLCEASKAGLIIEEYISGYERWYEFRSVLPIVKNIQSYTREVVNERSCLALSRLKCASNEDKEIVRTSISNTMNEILNMFIFKIRESGSREDIQTYFKCLSRLLLSSEDELRDNSLKNIGGIEKG